MNEGLEDKLSSLFPSGYVVVYIQGDEIRINKFNPFNLSQIEEAENKLLAYRED